MQDKFSRLINVLKNKLSSKKRNLNETSTLLDKKKLEERNTVKQIEEQQRNLSNLKADKKAYKRYPFYTLAFIAKLAVVLISSLASLGIIYWLRADVIATSQQNVIAGLCQPMTGWARLTLNGIYLGITILIAGFSIVAIKNATEEQKKLNTLRKKYPSLEQIESLIKSASLDLDHLTTSLQSIKEEIIALTSRVEILELEKNTLEQKLALAKDKFINACELIDSYKTESLLDIMPQEGLDESFARLDDEESSRKNEILSRTKPNPIERKKIDTDIIK